MKKVSSNVEWKTWGIKDPLMGVATRTGRGKGGPNAWTDEEFYELGRSDWDDFVSRWKRYGLDTTSCLEIGCGTGRFTRQLAQSFGTVYALDISEGMIEYAKRHVTASSVSFLLGHGTNVPVPDRSVGAVFSAHVFQHFDSLSHATEYFEEIARILVPGGTLMIHLPVHQWPAMPRAFDVAYHARKRIGDVRAWIARQLIRAGLTHHFMRGLSYPVGFLFGALEQRGFRDIEICVFRTKSENSVHPFVLARLRS